jgi:hypothetical protein
MSPRLTANADAGNETWTTRDSPASSVTRAGTPSRRPPLGDVLLEHPERGANTLTDRAILGSNRGRVGQRGFSKVGADKNRERRSIPKRLH